MRIAMLNWSGRRVGGAEQYLHRVLPALAAAGHATALFHETDDPARSAIAGERLRADPAALRAWRPDVIVNHGLLDPALEAVLTAMAPAVLVGHSYYGTCISGQKSFTWPAPKPCTHRLGWGCLLRYYPRRTGGLDPRTLRRQWQTQRARRTMLPRYGAIAVFSEHMRTEYTRHAGDPVRLLPFPIEPPATGARAGPGAGRLLFAGRCDPLKGGGTLIAALAHLPASVTLTVAGDGPARARWEAAARPFGDRVTFAGWRDDVGAAYADADLLIVPSLWPEPFGQVGLEAARFAVPAVAFPVGGIPEWLRAGENGVLAARTGDAVALADAIRRALEPATFGTLSAGAVRAVARHTVSDHVAALVRLLEEVA